MAQEAIYRQTKWIFCLL